MTVQLLRLVDLMCFCSKRADDVECGTIKIKFLAFCLRAIKLASLTFSLPYLYSYINIQSTKLYQVYGSPIFEKGGILKILLFMLIRC
jgi:hypothetical protein